MLPVKLGLAWASRVSEVARDITYYLWRTTRRPCPRLRSATHRHHASVRFLRVLAQLIGLHLLTLLHSWLIGLLLWVSSSVGAVGMSHFPITLLSCADLA